jgi:transposase
MLDRIDAFSADIDALSAQIQVVIAPFATHVTQLDEIPGVGLIGAQELVAELGVDMTRFPTVGHLASWAKFAPVGHKSAGKGKAAAVGKGNAPSNAPSSANLKASPVRKSPCTYDPDPPPANS